MGLLIFRRGLLGVEFMGSVLVLAMRGLYFEALEPADVLLLIGVDGDR